ncbi:MAG: hypothetical protein LUI13_09140 [Lachnospiraceae bacterium]|nr:hypothetical protein [Lachnospiraceae bacterium]
MRTIEIYTETVQTGIGHSSKGNQLKWLQDGWWYKADAFGFESLAETAVSALLEHSTIQDFVRYEPVMIRYQDKDFRGCRSRSFRRETEELVPLERLSRIYTGFGLAQELSCISGCRERILYTEKLVRNVTGIRNFGEYLTKMLEMDAFFLNEDRHTNNIAVLYDIEKRTWRLCPFFDMGLSLFSDTREAYPLESGFTQCREKITAKPFSVDFDEQLDAAEELYGTFLQFDFSRSTIAKLLTGDRLLGGEGEQNRSDREKAAIKRFETLGKEYSEREFQRVEEVLRYQAGKYQYFFCGRSGLF